MNIITIDGPASSGKGTIAREIALRLDYKYLDSGAIYRVLALIIYRNKIKLDDFKQIIEFARSINITFINKQVLLDSEDVTDFIRNENIGLIASSISANSDVRKQLLALQRSFAKPVGLVTDGRDMGTIVFPEANLKIFLTADIKVRAKRRQLQLGSTSVTIEPILQDIMLRDKQDTSRGIAPLLFNEDFKVLDNTNLTVKQTVSQILKWFNEVK